MPTDMPTDIPTDVPSAAPTCPVADGTIACTLEIAPVQCDDGCVFPNACGANATMFYTEGQCCPIAGEDSMVVCSKCLSQLSLSRWLWVQ